MIKMKEAEWTEVASAVEIIEDVAERKKGEEKLRISGEGYRVLYETIRNGIVAVDMDGRIVECNQAFANMVGYSKDELKNLFYQKLTPKQWHQMEAKISSEQVMKRGYSDEYEKEYIRKDGTVFPISVRVWLIRDEDGKPKGIWSIIRDITERKRTEEALRESEAKWRSITENSPDHIMLLDRDANIRFINWTLPESTTEQVIGTPIYNYVPAKFRRAMKRCFERVLKTGEHDQYECEYRATDGGIRSFEARVAPVKRFGQIVALTVSARDVTERERMEVELQDYFERLEQLVEERTRKLRKSEDRYRGLIEKVKDIIYTLDDKGDITFVSPAVETKLGYRLEEVLGKNFMVLIPKEWQEKTRADFNSLLETGEITAETVLLDKKGQSHFVEYSSTVIKEGNKVVGIRGIARDITERKRLQEKILRSEKLAAIGQLAASVGHEIRNPLGVINNSCYFLNRKLKDIADEKVERHLRIIERNIRCVNVIISDLLDFARKKPPTLNQIDLNDVVMKALSSIPIPQNIKVTTKLGEIPPMLLDEEQIRRVFQNMILNAFQATPEGGKVVIKTSKHDDSVKITFKDTGVGIEEENLPKLFTPLFSTKAKGVGLGLAICKQIVEDHGGDITAKSKGGKGSAFTVKLPIRAKEDVDEKSSTIARLPVGRMVKSEK